MPTRTDIEAATPKCPVGVPDSYGLVLTPGTEPCLRPLRFDATDDYWLCPIHGHATTPQSLVCRQGTAAVA